MVLILVRCQDGMVLIPREMSRWYGFDTRETLRLYGFDPSWDVEMVWFWSLVRRMVWFGSLVRCRRLRDYILKRLYGLDSSWEVVMILVPREKLSPCGLPRETSSDLDLVILNPQSAILSSENFSSIGRIIRKQRTWSIVHLCFLSSISLDKGNLLGQAYNHGAAICCVELICNIRI